LLSAIHSEQTEKQQTNLQTPNGIRTFFGFAQTLCTLFTIVVAIVDAFLASTVTMSVALITIITVVTIMPGVKPAEP
jgi:hypothetical protein